MHWRIAPGPLALAAILSACGPSLPPPSAAPPTADGRQAISARVLSERVELGDLDEDGIAAFARITNDELCYSGQPLSVAEGLLDLERCPEAVRMAGFVLRGLMEGEAEAEVAEQLTQAFMGWREQSVVEIDLSDHAPLGEANAPVVIVTYSDFECPYCRRGAEALEKLVERNPGKVRVYFKHFPLNQHANAMPASLAADAARRQGRFWEMHDFLYEHQLMLGESAFDEGARELELDQEKFDADRGSDAAKARVAADRAEGDRVGVASTPTWYVNGRRFDLPKSIANLEDRVEQELELKR